MSAESTTSNWHAMELPEVLLEVNATTTGLSSADAAQRRELAGPNRLTFTARDPAWRTMLRQFASPLIVILLLAAAITLLLQHWADAIAIMLVLLLNAAVGFWQERKAAAEVSALASLAVPNCRVRRDGSVQAISADDVVPGDLVLLESGEKVPADLRLVKAKELQVDESMLTGENFPVMKGVVPVAADAVVADRLSLAFSGTLVTSGRGVGVVVATGERSELGKINELIQGPKAPTPLEQLIHRLEKGIGVAVGSVAAFVFIAGLIVGADFGQAFLSAVALAVAAIPEALPVVLTIAMALGVRRMAKVNAVVRTLTSVETLGSTNVIGSDKTGTLTENLLTVGQVWTTAAVVELRAHGAGEHAAQLDELARATLRAGAMTNEARPHSDSRSGFLGDAVDVAMAAAAVRWAGVSHAQFEEEPVLHEHYEPALGYSQTLRRQPDGSMTLFVKGAPDKLVQMCDSMLTEAGPTPLDVSRVHAANEDMARIGLRVLATAQRNFDLGEMPERALPHPDRLTLLGLQGMADPPRDGVADAIASCRTAGIDVIMITGDHPTTAAAIAEALGINAASPLTGREIAQLDNAELVQRLRETGVAARVTPQEKLRIVEALRSIGDVVAVTGDGVNDAPALKAASIGVAMGASGTEVAREAADIVLTDDNFATIVRAVEQGRVTFAALRKATFFLLSTAVAVMLAVSFNVVSGLPLLFLPIQVLWINVVTNGLQDVALAFEPAEGGELRRPPRKHTEGLLSKALWIRIAVTGLWMGVCILGAFRWALDNGYAEEHARTLALTVFVALNFFQAYNSRTQHRSLFTVNPFSNPLLAISAFGSLALQWAAMNWAVSAGLLGLTPLSVSEWVACLVIGASVLVLVEMEKLVRRLRSRSTTRSLTS